MIAVPASATSASALHSEGYGNHGIVTKSLVDFELSYSNFASVRESLREEGIGTSRTKPKASTAMGWAHWKVTVGLPIK